MIAALALVTLISQATPPPAPLRENQAPVYQTPAPSTVAPVPGIDRIFAQAAIQGNDAELEMAHLAIQRSAIPEVKGFAQKMISEHMGLADDMLPALHRVLGTPPAERLAAADLLALDNLRTISDVDFDQAYAEQQVGDHLATLTAFRAEAENGTDPQLKALARKWMPTIEAHLQLAVGMTQHIGGDSPLKMH